MTNNRIIIRPAIAQKFQNCMEQGRIFFISAPCGFGKTSIAETLTAGYNVRRMSAEKPDIAEAAKDPQWEILLVDDLQQIQNIRINRNSAFLPVLGNHHPKPRSRSSRPQSIHGIPSDLNTLQGMAHMKDLPFGLKIFPAQRTQFPQADATVKSQQNTGSAQIVTVEKVCHESGGFCIRKDSDLFFLLVAEDCGMVWEYSSDYI